MTPTVVAAIAESKATEESREEEDRGSGAETRQHHKTSETRIRSVILHLRGGSRDQRPSGSRDGRCGRSRERKRRPDDNRNYRGLREKLSRRKTDVPREEFGGTSKTNRSLPCATDKPTW